MKAQYLRALTGFSAITMAVLFATGCTPSIDGKYQDASGAMTVDIHGDKATIAMGPLGSAETAMKRDGDKVTLTYDKEPLVLTIKPDGVLEGDHVKFTKKQ